MNILSRCSDIIAANINALLDRAENPEAMIAQIVREMEASLAAVRGHAAKTIAVERWLNRELTKQRAEIEHWQTKARTAVAANRDDLARLALTRKKELENSAVNLAIQHTIALGSSTQARSALDTLEANLAAARGKQRTLIARHRAAQVRRELCRVTGKRLGSVVTLDSKLQHWDQRITDLEDEIAAEAEIQGLAEPEKLLAQCEIDGEIDHELSVLKEETSRKQSTVTPLFGFGRGLAIKVGGYFRRAFWTMGTQRSSSSAIFSTAGMAVFASGPFPCRANRTWRNEWWRAAPSRRPARREFSASLDRATAAENGQATV